MHVLTKVFSGVVVALALAACGGGSSSTNGGSSGSGGAGGSGNGSLTISSASPSSLNGTCSANNITSTTTTTPTGVYVNRQATLSCGASSKLSFIVDTSTNTLVDGDTTITLTNAGTGVMAFCTGPSMTCPQVSLDASAKKLTFTNQAYSGGGISFTVNGSVNY